MPLIQSIAEVKAVLRISNFSDDADLPDIEQAEEKHIIPLIGQALYDQALAAYGNAAAPALDKRLLEKIQKPLAAFAYLDDLGLIHAMITDSGVRTTSTGNMEAAHRWEFNEVKDTLEDKGLSGLESLLKFLEDNKADLPNWTASDEYAYYHSFLIKSGVEFSKIYPLFQPLRTFIALQPEMEKAETIYLEPEIGEDFLDELKATPDPDANTEKLLKLLKRALVYYAIKHAIEDLPVRISNNGFTVVSEQAGSNDNAEPGRKPAPDNWMTVKMEAAERDGDHFLKLAVKFLNKTATDELFATYYNSEYYTPPTTVKKFDKGNEGRKIFRL